ncbi:MOSC domain-containing protein [Kitasatospora sp. NPDC006697]|uniref:MOSC domain-containing protein n=1 Tax=Kitasatospora sp. NPDC006697 TaxID=3364020 RepID=UPI003698153E
MEIESICRYPVKSMQGEEMTAAEVTERGLPGDRELALVDVETGKVVSAKHPTRWGRLLRMQAATTSDGIEITGPDGLHLAAAKAADSSAVLSRLLGREVELTTEPPEDAQLDRITTEGEVEVPRVGNRLAAAAPGTFFDFAPLHLITTATLHSTGMARQRYRPNLVIRTDSGERYPENDWLGQDLRIGPDLHLRIIARTPRCAIPGQAHGQLPPEPEALRVVNRENRVIPIADYPAMPCAGVYAKVLHPGRISPGDRVVVQPAAV